MTAGFNPAEMVMFVLGIGIGAPVAAVIIVFYWFRR